MEAIAEFQEARRLKDKCLQHLMFEKEIEAVEKLIKTGNNADWRVERKIENMVFDSVCQFKDKIDELEFRGKIFRLGKLMTEAGFYRCAWLWLSYYFNLCNCPIDLTLKDLKGLKRHAYFQEGHEETIPLMLNLFMKHAVHRHDVVREDDIGYNFQETFEHAKMTLEILLTLSRFAMIKTEWCWVTYNGSVHMYNIFRKLMDLKMSSSIIPFLDQIIKCLDFSPVLCRSSYFLWKQTLMMTYCLMLYETGDFDGGLTLAKSVLAKLQESRNSAVLTKEENNCDEYIQKWNMIIFKYNVYLRPKNQLSNKQTSLKQGLRKSETAFIVKWPRSAIEEYLQQELGNNRIAQISFIFEALSFRNRNMFDTESLTPLEDYDNTAVLEELFEAAKYLIQELEFKSHIGLFAKLAKLAYNFERWNDFSEIINKLCENVKLSQKNLIAYEHENRSTLLEIQVLLALNDLQDWKKSLVNMSPDYKTAPSLRGYMNRLAWAIKSCLEFWSDETLDKDLILQSAFLLWNITYAELYQVKSPFDFYLKINKGFQSEWRDILDTIHSTICASKFDFVDPLLSAELSLRYAYFMQSLANSTEPQVLLRKELYHACQDVWSLNERFPSCSFILHLTDTEENLKSPDKQLHRLQLGLLAADKGLRAINSIRRHLDSPSKTHLTPRKANQINNQKEMNEPSKAKSETSTGLAKGKQTFRNLSPTSVPDLHLELLNVYVSLFVQIDYLKTKYSSNTGRSSSKYMAKKLISPSVLDDVVSKCKEEVNSCSVSKAFYSMYCFQLQKSKAGDSRNKAIEDIFQLISKYDNEQKRFINYQKRYDMEKIAPVSSAKVNMDQMLPSPLLLSVSDTRMWFSPNAVLESKFKISWYRLFGKVITGPDRKVYLGDDSLHGTGSLINATDDIIHEVSDLQFLKSYVFALAAYDECGNIIGGKIGESTSPILACSPFPLITLWCLFTKLAYQNCNWNICMQCCKNLFKRINVKHYKHPKLSVKCDQNLMTSEEQWNLEDFTQLTEVQSHVVVITIMYGASGFINEKMNDLPDSVKKLINQKYMMQANEWASYLILALSIAENIKANELIMQIVLLVFNILVPFMHFPFYNERAAKKLKISLNFLKKLLESNDFISFKQTKTDSIKELLMGLAKIIACATYYIVNYHLHCNDKRIIAENQLMFGRKLLHLLFSEAYKAAGDFQMPQDLVHAFRNKEEWRPMKQQSPLYLSRFEAILDALWFQWFSNSTLLPTSLQGNEDPIVLIAYISGMIASEAYEFVKKFTENSVYLKILSPLLCAALWEGLHEKILQWSGQYFSDMESHNKEMLQGSKTYMDQSKGRISRLSQNVELSYITQSLDKDLKRALIKELKKEEPFFDKSKIKPSKLGGMKSPKGKSSPLSLLDNPEYQRLISAFQPVVKRYKTKKYVRYLGLHEQPQKALVRALQAVSRFMALVEEYPPLVDVELLPYNPFLPLNYSGLEGIGAVIIPNLDLLSEGKKINKSSIKSSSMLEIFCQGCVCFTRSLVLSHRCKLWSLFLNTCTQLWNSSKFLLSCLYNCRTVPQIHIFQLKLELWKPFYFASSSWLDAAKAIDEHCQMLYEPYYKLLLIKISMKAMEYLYLAKKYDRIVEIGLKFLPLTQNSPSFHIISLLLHCNILRKERLGSQSVPSVKKLKLFTSDSLLLNEYYNLIEGFSAGKKLLFHSQQLLSVFLFQQAVVSLTVHKPNLSSMAEAAYLPPFSTMPTTLSPDVLKSNPEIFGCSSYEKWPSVHKTSISSTYSKAIDLLSREDKCLALLALHDLGCWYIYCSDTKRAQVWWKKAVDLVFPQNFKWQYHLTKFVENMELNELLKSWIDIFHDASTCIILGFISLKIAKYTISANCSESQEWLYLAACLFCTAFSFENVHPVVLVDFSLYRLPIDIPFLSASFFIEDNSFCNGASLVPHLHWLAKILIDFGQSLLALPVICLHEYICRYHIMNHFEIVWSHVLRFRALSNLKLFSKAFIIYQWILEEKATPLMLAVIAVGDKRFRSIQEPQLHIYTDTESPSESRNWQILSSIFSFSGIQEIIEDGSTKLGNDILLMKAHFLNIFRQCLSHFPIEQQYSLLEILQNQVKLEEISTDAKNLKTALTIHALKLLQIIPSRIKLIDPKLEKFHSQFIELERETASNWLNFKLPLMSALILAISLWNLQKLEHPDDVNLSDWLSTRLLLTRSLVEVKLCAKNLGRIFMEPLYCSLDGAAESEIYKNDFMKAQFLKWASVLKMAEQKDSESSLMESMKLLETMQYRTEGHFLILVEILLLLAHNHWNSMCFDSNLFYPDIDILNGLYNKMEFIMNNMLKRNTGWEMREILESKLPNLSRYADYLPFLAHYLLGSSVLNAISSYLSSDSNGLSSSEKKLEDSLNVNSYSLNHCPWFEVCAYYNLANLSKILYRDELILILKKYRDALKSLFVEKIDLNLFFDVCLEMADVTSQLQNNHLSDHDKADLPTSAEENIQENNTSNTFLENSKILHFILVSEAVLISKAFGYRSLLSSNISCENFTKEALLTLSPTIVHDVIGIKALVGVEKQGNLDLKDIMVHSYNITPLEMMKRTSLVSESLKPNQLMAYYEDLYERHSKSCKAKPCIFLETDTYSCINFIHPSISNIHKYWSYRLQLLDSFFTNNLDGFSATCIVPDIRSLIDQAIFALETSTNQVDLASIMNLIPVEKESVLYYWQNPYEKMVNSTGKPPFYLLYFAAIMNSEEADVQLLSNCYKVKSEKYKAATEHLEKVLMAVYSPRLFGIRLPEIDVAETLQNLFIESPGDSNKIASGLPTNVQNLTALGTFLNQSVGILQPSHFTSYLIQLFNQFK